MCPTQDRFFIFVTMRGTLLGWWGGGEAAVRGRRRNETVSYVAAASTPPARKRFLLHACPVLVEGTGDNAACSWLGLRHLRGLEVSLTNVCFSCYKGRTDGLRTDQTLERRSKKIPI